MRVQPVSTHDLHSMHRRDLPREFARTTGCDSGINLNADQGQRTTKGACRSQKERACSCREIENPTNLVAPTSEEVL